MEAVWRRHSGGGKPSSAIECATTQRLCGKDGRLFRTRISVTWVKLSCHGGGQGFPDGPYPFGLR
jgi:hypothetical protein